MTRVIRKRLRENGLVAELFLQKGQDRLAAVVVMTGSDGGTGYARMLARSLAHAGFATMALAYFKIPPLPRTLAEIPLEYFRAAIDRLKAEPRVDAACIGRLGFSKGAEAALLVASHYPDVKAVAAVAPSGIAWESLDYRSKTPRPSWTLNGAPVPFVAYDKSKRYKSIFEMYSRSLASAKNLAEATIAIERVNGALLFLSGERDGLMPHKRMAEDAMARLDEKGFAHFHKHVCYADAGHMILPLSGYRAILWGGLLNWLFGGSRKANAQARRDCRRQIVGFFTQQLKNAT